MAAEQGARVCSRGESGFGSHLAHWQQEKCKNMFYWNINNWVNIMVKRPTVTYYCRVGDVRLEFVSIILLFFFEKDSFQLIHKRLRALKG